MTYFPSIPSQTWITTTDKTTHPKIQPLLCPAVEMPQVPCWDQQCPARIPNPAPGVLTWAGAWWSTRWGDTSTCCWRNTSPNPGASWNGGHLTAVTVLLLLPAEPLCEGQSVHQQPVPLLPLREEDVCPCLLMPVPVLSLPAVPALSPAHMGTWGPSSHPPVATHPLILFPNMAMSFSLNHP